MDFSHSLQTLSLLKMIITLSAVFYTVSLWGFHISNYEKIGQSICHFQLLLNSTG